MKTNIFAGIIFAGILASSVAQASTAAKTKSVNEADKAYLAATEEIQKQYAGYGVGITREALVRLSAYYYPDFAAQQTQVAQKCTDHAYMAAAYGAGITSQRDAN